MLYRINSNRAPGGSIFSIDLCKGALLEGGALIVRGALLEGGALIVRGALLEGGALIVRGALLEVIRYTYISTLTVRTPAIVCDRNEP